MHIEPFNYAIESVCFEFHSTNMGSSVIRTGRSTLLLPILKSLTFNYLPYSLQDLYTMNTYETKVCPS